MSHRSRLSKGRECNTYFMTTPNVAKLTRAAVDSVVRQSANAIDLPADKLVLTQETEDAATALAAMGVIAGLVTALRRGAVGLREGRFTMLVSARR